MPALFSALEGIYTSAAKIAAALGMTRQAYNQAAKRRRLSDRAAIRAAALLNIDPGQALLTNATRESGGEFHFFDLEWRLPGDLPASWWILRNVAACLDMLGPRFPAAGTGAELYVLLCRQICLSPQLEADLAREAQFGAER